MSASIKVILIVVIGIGACVLSVASSQYFRETDRNNLMILAHTQRVAEGIERTRLLGKSFVQNADEYSWARINQTLDSVHQVLQAASARSARWEGEIGLLRQSLNEYDAILARLYAPVTALRAERESLQDIGLTFSQQVREEIIDPYRRDEAFQVFEGRSIEPFKSRVKDEAYDLVSLHTEQQLILLELLLSSDLDAYERRKSTLSAAVARHEAQLRYLALLMADAPELQGVLESMEEKLNRLLDHEQAIIEHFDMVAALNRELDAAGNQLLAAGHELSAAISSDTVRTGRLNRVWNWSLLLGIVGGLGVLGALLARNIIRFVDDLRMAQQRLKESESVLKATLESTNDGVLVVTAGQHVSHCNTRFREMWSIPDAGQAFDDDALIRHVLPQVEDPDAFTDRIAAIYQTSEPSQDILRLKGGRLFERYSRTLPGVDGAEGRVWFFTDITEKTQLEAQLRQSQKMEAIGQLAGGVAHDFNNILTAMYGNIDLAIEGLKSQFPSASGVLEGMHEIERSAHRASALTRQLLAFSRRQTVRPEVLDLNSSVRDLEKMLRRLITESVELGLFLNAQPASVKVDPSQLEQVIINLVVNARDAMPEGGQLTLDTAVVTLDETYVGLHPEAGMGKHVLLSVSDTGIGMDRATLERVFEPFFTTKPMGHGTGLGLSTAFGIVKQAGGHMEVYSEPGRGTSFKVYLPAADGPGAAARPKTEEPPLQTGTETLVICEDDADVRQLTAQVLQDAGYAVLEAKTPEDALRLAGGHTGPIHLLVTDVIMPGMNGRKLSESLRSIRPEVRTLFVSGYTSNVIAHQGVLEDDVDFLGKPYSRRQLLQTVREVLDRNEATGRSL